MSTDGSNEFKNTFGKLGVIITSLVTSIIAVLAAGWYLGSYQIAPLREDIMLVNDITAAKFISVNKDIEFVRDCNGEQDQRLAKLEDYDKQLKMEIDANKKEIGATGGNLAYAQKTITEVRRIAWGAQRSVNYLAKDMEVRQDGSLAIKSDPQHLTVDNGNITIELVKPVGKIDASTAPASTAEKSHEQVKEPPATSSTESKTAEATLPRGKRAEVKQIVVVSPPPNVNPADKVAEPTVPSAPAAPASTVKTATSSGTGTGTGNPTAAPAPVVQPPPVQPPASK